MFQLLAFVILTNISILLAAECNAGSFVVQADAQTPFYFDNLNVSSPDCDDTVVWINPSSPKDSRIISTLKEGGLAVFRLDGTKVQEIPCQETRVGDEPSRFNNVDIIKNETTNYIVVSDRGKDQLRFYTINDQLMLEDKTNGTIPYVFSSNQEEVNNQETAYGLTATIFGGEMLVFVSKRHQSAIGVGKIKVLPNRLVTYEIVDIIQIPVYHTLGDSYNWTACMEDVGETPQIEGMVADPERDIFMISQESVGLYRTSISNMQSDIILVDQSDIFGVEYSRYWDAAEDEYICVYNGTNHGETGNIIADAEGLSMYIGSNGKNDGYFILSSQGGNRYEIYDRSQINWIGSFTIYLGSDQAQHTDGVEIVSDYLGVNFKNGVIVVQDEGDNDDTNFKIVDMDKVLTGIQECLISTTSSNNPSANSPSVSPTSEDKMSIASRYFSVCFLSLAIIFFLHLEFSSMIFI